MDKTHVPVPAKQSEPPRKLTYADLQRIPEDGRRHEIIDGVLYVTAPLVRHQLVLGVLFYSLQSYLHANPLGLVMFGPVDFLADVHDIVEPDLIFLARGTQAGLTEKNLQRAPDLAVEVVSPSTRRRDRGMKRALYDRVGVREYWVVDPKDRTVVVHARRDGTFHPTVFAEAEVLRSALFPGWQLAVEKLFE